MSWAACSSLCKEGQCGDAMCIPYVLIYVCVRACARGVRACVRAYVYVCVRALRKLFTLTLTLTYSELIFSLRASTVASVGWPVVASSLI